MRPKVVICGSYHRDLDGLKKLFRELEITGCRILSPLSVDFINGSDSVVKLDSESKFNILELEKYHLRAIDEADLVWLHCPNGYVGISAAFEIGYCKAINKPVFCKQTPEDEMIASLISLSGSVFDSLEAISF